jgi:hypothetical protein
MRLFIKHALDRVCVLRSLKVSLVVGTILGVINHIDAIVHGPFTRTNLLQILLTYLVPFCVSTYGSAMQARHMELLTAGTHDGAGTRQKIHDIGVKSYE